MALKVVVFTFFFFLRLYYAKNQICLILCGPNFLGEYGYYAYS